MDMLRLYSTADMEACPLDKWGILDPGTHRRDLQGEREDGTLFSSSSPTKVVGLTDSDERSSRESGSHPHPRCRFRRGLQQSKLICLSFSRCERQAG